MLSVVGIVLEEVESKIIPINPTIIRVMRVLRIARGQCRELSHFEKNDV
jgi:voltage-dependent calcium channel T type alpha-1G